VEDIERDYHCQAPKEQSITLPFEALRRANFLTAFAVDKKGHAIHKSGGD
jgi:hypothetical protein